VPRTASAEGRECRGAQAPTIPGSAGARRRHAGVPQGRRTGVPPRPGSAMPENRGIPVPTVWGSPGRGFSRTDARGCRRPRAPTFPGAGSRKCRGLEVPGAELGDAGLVLVTLLVVLEDRVRLLQEGRLPGGQQVGAGGLRAARRGRGLNPGQDLRDDLGLELGGGIGVASSWVCVSLRTSGFMMHLSDPGGALHFPEGGAWAVLGELHAGSLAAHWVIRPEALYL